MPSNYDKSAPRIILVTLAVIMFVCLMVIVILQNALPKGTGFLRTYDDGYAEGFAKARDMAKSAWQSTLLPTVASGTQTSVNGIIDSVGAASFDITVSGVVVDERVDGVGMERTVNVSKSTKIVIQNPKDGAVLAKEMEAFNENRKNGIVAAPPIPYTETTLKISDLKIGDRVTIVSTEGEDATIANPITASKVIVMRIPEYYDNTKATFPTNTTSTPAPTTGAVKP